MAVDYMHDFGYTISLSPAVRTADENGASIDLKDAVGATAIICTGTLTDGTHTFELQESDDNSTFTAVAASDLIGSEPTATAGATPSDDDTVWKVGYTGGKRYLRVAVTVAGATSGGASAAILQKRPRELPA